MIAGSKGSPGDLQFKRWSLVVLVLCGACGLPRADPSPTPPPSPHVFITPSPIAPAASAYFVLATLGLRLHETPDPASPVVTVLRPAAELDATERRTVAGAQWLHVHAKNSPDLDGWVVNDPLLLTTVPVQQHIDSTSGYSMLVPLDWAFAPESTAVTTFTAPDKLQRLRVQAADSIEHLDAVPTAPGKAEREEGPIDVYGKSPVITFYRLQGGGYELALRLLWAPGRAFGFVLRQPSGDSTLMKQILASVIFQ